MSNRNESKASKVKAIRENRKTEKEFLRVKEHWGDTLDSPKLKNKVKVIEIEGYRNNNEEDEEGDYLLDLILQYDEKED